MRLSGELERLLVDDYPAVISITGAGGKTNTLKMLGKYFSSRGKSVLLTTTTKIQGPKHFGFDTDYSFTEEEDALMHIPSKSESVYYAQANLMDPKKMRSPRLEVLEILSKRYDVVLIEADGAKTLPLKLHTERDPVIVPYTTATLAIMGATSLGDKKDNVCFGYDGSGVVDIPFLQQLIDDKEGVLKGAAGRCAILINQCDAVADHDCFKALKAPCPIVLGSVMKDEAYV